MLLSYLTQTIIVMVIPVAIAILIISVGRPTPGPFRITGVIDQYSRDKSSFLISMWKPVAPPESNKSSEWPIIVRPGGYHQFNEGLRLKLTSPTENIDEFDRALKAALRKEVTLIDFDRTLTAIRVKDQENIELPSHFSTWQEPKARTRF